MKIFQLNSLKKTKRYNDKRTGAGVYHFNDESKYDGDFVQVYILK